MHVPPEARRRIERNAPITVEGRHGQIMCLLCAAFEDGLRQSKQVELMYKDFGELETISELGCQTCRVIRTAILYNHPSKNAHILLLGTEEPIDVRLESSSPATLSLHINYPVTRDSPKVLEDDQEMPSITPGNPMLNIMSSLFAGVSDDPDRIETGVLDIPVYSSRNGVSLEPSSLAQSPVLESSTSKQSPKPRRRFWRRSRTLGGASARSVLGNPDERDDSRASSVPIDAPDQSAPSMAAPTVIETVPIAATPMTQPAILQLQQWLFNCCKDHKACRGPPSTYRPMRVIDIRPLIGVSGIARVRRLFDDKEEYACLSYCWGKQEQNYFQLLSANIAQLELGFPIQDLPATLRDAIELVNLLGIRCIWIDALCIVQDDESDWHIQAPRMGEIYSNAALTIAAVSARHADDGICKLRAAACFPLRNCSYAGYHLSLPVPMLDRYLDDAPIKRRAWTTQELRLSRRIIYVTEAFTAWECGCLRALEFAPEQGSVKAEMGSFNLWQVPSSSPSDPEVAKAYSTWQELVCEYSTKLMTYENDILVAAAGLAQAIGSLTNDSYLAGLWKGHIIPDLMWYSNESRRRSQHYTAPTWSWASTHPKKSGRGAETVSISFRAATPETSLVAEVLDPVVRTVESMPFGQVTAAQIEIRGKLAEAVFFFDSNWAVHGGEGFTLCVPKYGRVIGQPNFDTHDQVKYFQEFDKVNRERAMDSQLYCLPMARRDRVPKYKFKSDKGDRGYDVWFYALLLEEVEEHEWTAGGLVHNHQSLPMYRRVGFADLEIKGGNIEAYENLAETRLLII